MFLGKGFGMVRISPLPKVKVDVYVAHLIAGCDKLCDKLALINSTLQHLTNLVRLRQTNQILDHIDRSVADVVSINLIFL